MTETMATEFVIASDGVVFVNTAELAPGKTEGRGRFRGWVLEPNEVAALRSKALAELSGVVLGCDGRIYGDEEHVAPAHREQRLMFEGVALTADERDVAVEELVRLAFNITTCIDTLCGANKKKRSGSRSRRAKA
ncbi:MAG TPA: hypothetical protein VM580_18735 [Labilithrix sp.]|nr:hypothetical protein [Labilithrix sp.]